MLLLTWCIGYLNLLKLIESNLAGFEFKILYDAKGVIDGTIWVAIKDRNSSEWNFKLSQMCKVCWIRISHAFERNSNTARFLTRGTRKTDWCIRVPKWGCLVCGGKCRHARILFAGWNQTAASRQRANALTCVSNSVPRIYAHLSFGYTHGRCRKWRHKPPCD